MTVAQYTTTDPYLSSFLLSQGAVLLGCTRLGPKRVEFRFAADRRLHELLYLYRNQKPTLVVPAHLFGALRRLKSRSIVRP
jgi:hypothetical protein